MGKFKLSCLLLLLAGHVAQAQDVITTKPDGSQTLTGSTFFYNPKLAAIFEIEVNNGSEKDEFIFSSTVNTDLRGSVVTIKPNGKVLFGPNYRGWTSSIEFWREIAKMTPSFCRTPEEIR